MKAEKQNLLFNIFTAVFVALAVLVMLFLIFDWKIDYKTHAKWEADGITVTLKGNGKKARKIIVKGEGIQSAKLPFSADASVGKAEVDAPILLQDVNFDGERDLLVLCAYDEDADLHHTVYLYDKSSNSFTAQDTLLSLANVTLSEEEQEIRTHQTFRTVLAKKTEHSPEIYEECKEITVYANVNQKLIPIRRTALTYYSESNIYCYAEQEYDEEYGELSDKQERWLEPDEIEKYAAIFTA